MHTPSRLAVLSLVTAALAILATCSSNHSPTGPDDAIPPSAVSDLAAGGATDGSITLWWTAPGDDGTLGTAAAYDVRYSRSTITEANWAAAQQAVGEPKPRAAGGADSFAVSFLYSDTRYYFALKTADEAGNWSSLSNSATEMTLVSADVTPPSAVSDLVVIDTTFENATISWTSPGDDGSAGTATAYDIRYHLSPIVYGNWDSAVRVADPPPPKPAGMRDTLVVNGLSPSTTYYFAMRAADEKPNWSPLSNGAAVTTPAYRDVKPPAAVTDLAAGEPLCYSIKLTWTAPADDTTAGTPSQYDIRYSRAPIDESSWDAAAQCAQEPEPGAPGAPDSFTVNGLNPETTWHFAMKTADDSGNWSALSNGASAATAIHGCWTALRPGGSCCAIASTVWNGDLLVSVSDASGHNLLSWNGAEWTQLASANEKILVLAEYDGALVAGGQFTEIGGVAANHIASWDGAAWSPLGSGVSGVIQEPYTNWPSSPWVAALGMYEGRLIAGGYFVNAGGVQVNHIASWDGIAWAPLGAGLQPDHHWVADWGTSPVNAITVYNGALVAGGGLSEGIAIWNGISWQNIPGTNLALDLTVYDGKLIAGGVNIASWDGSSLSLLGAGADPFISRLCVYDGRLIAAGTFRSNPAYGIAVWNGVRWSSLGAGLDFAICGDLAVLGDQLIACGYFEAAGGEPTIKYIAAWRD